MGSAFLVSAAIEVGTMRILIAGSYRKEDELNKVFVKLTQAIGRAAAEYGHTVMVESLRPSTFDLRAVEGAAASGLSTAIEVHSIIDFGPVRYDSPQIDIHLVPYRRPAEESGDKKLWSRIGAVAACDVIVMAGGGKGTDQMGDLAIELRKPVVSVPGFDGVSDKWFDSFVVSYESRQQLHNGTFALKTAVEAVQAAEGKDGVRRLGREIIEFAEIMAEKQRYFLSYAHENLEIADHLETLLLRARRVVFRDEAKLLLGQDLKDRIEAHLQRTDTFIGLWSAHYNVSDWCQRELELALDLRQKRNRPRRVNLVLIDDTPVPNKMRNALHVCGQSRSGREAGVARILAEELCHGD
jgi:hypothetical protein